MIKNYVKNVSTFFFSSSQLSQPDGESSRGDSEPDRAGNILQGLIKH